MPLATLLAGALFATPCASGASLRLPAASVRPVTAAGCLQDVADRPEVLVLLLMASRREDAPGATEWVLPAAYVLVGPVVAALKAELGHEVSVSGTIEWVGTEGASRLSDVRADDVAGAPELTVDSYQRLSGVCLSPSE